MCYCLLCLNTEDKMVGNIRVNSLEWQTKNIQDLIYKHLWPMDTNSKDMVCIGCWHELENFHRFYVLIEKSHAVLGTIRKIENRKESMEHINSKWGDQKDSNDECKEKYPESHIETEMFIEHTLSTECVLDIENPLIKLEQNETLLEEKPLKQGRKRGRPPKDIICELTNCNSDPLVNREKKSKPNTKSAKKLKKISKNGNVAPETRENVSVLKSKIEAVEISNGAGKSLEARQNIESDTEYENYDTPLGSKTCTKKRKNPDKKTLQEYDKIIAENFKISCSLCQIPLDNFIALRKHFRKEHKKRGFMICCKKKFFNRPILVDHLNFHLDPNYFKCIQCGKVYSDRCTLEKHLKVHVNGENRNHICNECGKSFVSLTQLENHKLTHAPDYKKKFSCCECGKFFTTSYNLNYHIQAIHRNKYAKICDICGKTIRNSFKLHMEKHDRKITTFIHCDICGLRLIDKRSLNQHKNSQHPVGGKKQFVCHICSKISKSLRALRTHVRFAHETGYIHKCTICDKAFKRPEALKEHIATHTGTPLYTCPWCPKTFMSNGNMYNHRKNAHPKKWEELQRQKYVNSAFKEETATVDYIEKQF